jgi:ElaB/YqjD/DUF883 family membrane-anchored ribosome-binding protein
MTDAKKGLYAVLGSGDLAIDRTKQLVERIQGYLRDSRGRVGSGYRDLVRRGERTVASVNRTPAVKRAKDQTKTARSRVKGAATSVRKALGANVEAVQTAAKKVS